MRSFLTPRGLLASSALSVALLSSATAFAQTYALAPDINVAAATPVTQTFNVTTPGSVYGFSYFSNWSAVSGNPFSSEHRVNLTGPSLAATGALSVGGASNGNATTFGNSPFTTTTAFPSAFLLAPGGTPAVGTWSVTLSQTFAGSVARVQNASINLYTDLVQAITGTTVGGATFQRPVQDGVTLGTGTTFNYSATSFTVPYAGRFMLTSTAAYDSYLLLYANGFNAATPLTNLVGADDDGTFVSAPNIATGNPTFTAVLTPGVTYTLVNSAFAVGTTGAFNSYVIGLGAPAVTVAPEPGSIALLFLGGTALLAPIAARRRGMR